MSETSKKNYRDSLNLPKTSFSMKANLTQKEPAQRKAWSKEDIYGQTRSARKDCPQFILHDGPPYANGDIHMGHVINKVLKDIVVKYKTMKGFDSPYIPGWDCHGLPIEVKVMEQLGQKALETPKEEVRKQCRKYASKFVKKQAKQFQELGIFGDFDKPYLTMIPAYEEGILEVFAELVEKGLVFKQLKPIHWSIGCETALADAELEYKDIHSPSIFVNFPVTEETRGRLIEMGLADKDYSENVCMMIWTTTPWTLAANLGIVVHPDLDYKSITYEQYGRKFTSIVAVERIKDVIEAAGLEVVDVQISKETVKGNELQGLRYKHPFVEQNPTDKDAWFVIGGRFVTTEDGTGLVHCAPGHGVEDYHAGLENEMAVYSPVLDDGCYDDTVPEWLKGKSVTEVDPDVIIHLKDKGLLFHEEQISHSYPHCWRSKTPVIFRATEQWFIGVDRKLENKGKTLRELAMERIGQVQWIPAWGEKRIAGMLESRPDWCISRQRAWGLPIPAFYNSKGQTLLTAETVRAVAAHIGSKGADSWFKDSPREILGEDFELPAGFDFNDLQKEENIFDVWFESGCSWHSVARKQGWDVPVDLYLEGSDQHRGWFQLSLLPALGAIEKEPFKAVLTHGFTVDEHGMKQSKSLGNYVNALDEINKYGSDILRMWVSSVNYQEDMRCSDALIGRMQDAYRKIRNTVRYLLGNIQDFEPSTMDVAYEQMFGIDKWAMQSLQKLIAEVTAAYDNFLFHRVFSLIYNFCTVEMSSIYMDVLKDRMYCDPADSLSRRSGQTAMWRILDAIVRLLAPIIPHTAEEIWAVMAEKRKHEGSVHLAMISKPDPKIDYQSNEPKWNKIMKLRDEILRVLEELRQNDEIASNQQASVSVVLNDDELLNMLEKFGHDQFAAMCIVSEIDIQRGDADQAVSANKSEHQKCQRCWNFWPSVGQNDEHPDLCSRCIKAVSAI